MFPLYTTPDNIYYDSCTSLEMLQLAVSYVFIDITIIAVVTTSHNQQNSYSKIKILINTITFVNAVGFKIIYLYGIRGSQSIHGLFWAFSGLKY